MKRKTLLTAFLTLILLSGVISGSGSAEAHDTDRWNDHGRHKGWDRHDDDRNDWSRGRGYSYDYNDRYSAYPIVRINLSPWDRADISRRMEREYWEKCRTVAGQRYHNCGSSYSGHGMSYRTGSKLPPQAVVWNVPRSVTPYLPRATHGTRYVWVDRDILLITSDGGIVLDSVRIR